MLKKKEDSEQSRSREDESSGSPPPKLMTVTNHLWMAIYERLNLGTATLSVARQEE